MDYEQVEGAIDVDVGVEAVERACQDLRFLAAAWAGTSDPQAEGGTLRWEVRSGERHLPVALEVAAQEPGRFIAWEGHGGEQGWLVYDALGPGRTRLQFMGRYPYAAWHDRMGLDADGLRVRMQAGLRRLKVWLEDGNFRSGPNRLDSGDRSA